MWNLDVKRLSWIMKGTLNQATKILIEIKRKYREGERTGNKNNVAVASVLSPEVIAFPQQLQRAKSFLLPAKACYCQRLTLAACHM